MEFYLKDALSSKFLPAVKFIDPVTHYQATFLPFFKAHNLD